MVTRFIKLLSREFSSLHQAAFLIAGASLVAQLLGLMRDRLLAGTFGAGSELDVYYLAFRIPDLVYVSFASFVSVTVLIPFILKKQESGGAVAVKKFLSNTLTVFILAMVLVSAGLFLLMPYLAPVIAPGLSQSSLAEMILLSRILLLSPFFLGLSNLLGSVTQSYRKFFAYTLSPVIYNLGIIFGLVFLYPSWGLIGLVWGVVLGAIGHMLIQVPSVAELKVLPRLIWSINWPEIGRVILISLPRTITLSAHQLSLLVLVALGSLMASGSVAIFNLAFNLQSFPLVIIGVSYSVAAFPTLTALYSNGEMSLFVSKIEVAVRHIFFWSLPAIVLFLILRAHIVRVILGSGEFSWQDTRLTAAVLALFVVSVVAQGLVQLFVRAYYAAGQTLKPLVVNTMSSILIIFLALGLVYSFDNLPQFKLMIETLLRVKGLEGTSILMLPLAYSIGLIVNATIYWLIFSRNFKQLNFSTYLSIGRSCLSAIATGLATYLSLWFMAPLIPTETFLIVFSQGLIAGLVGIMAGLVVLVLIKSEELKQVVTSVKKKIWPKPILAEAEDLI